MKVTEYHIEGFIFTLWKQLVPFYLLKAPF